MSNLNSGKTAAGGKGGKSGGGKGGGNSKSGGGKKSSGSKGAPNTSASKNNAGGGNGGGGGKSGGGGGTKSAGGGGGGKAGGGSGGGKSGGKNKNSAGAAGKNAGKNKSTNNPWRPQQASTNRKSNDDAARRFLRQIAEARPERLAQQIVASATLWQQCWASAGDSFTRPELHDLAVVLARVPFSAVIPPPPLHSWESAMVAYLQQSNRAGRAAGARRATTTGNMEDSSDMLAAVEIVVNVVKKMQSFEWEDDLEVVRAHFGAVLGEASDSLSSVYKDQRDTKQQILKMIDEFMEKSWAIKIKPKPSSSSAGDSTSASSSSSSGDDASAAARLHHNNWPSATVEWVCQSQLFTPALLPKMQVPDSKSRGVYESRDQYLDTMERLMVGMTFSEAYTALSPCCWDKVGDKACGRTLFPIDLADPHKQHSVGNLWCRTRDCRGPVVFVCPDGRHSRGLCVRCGEQARQRLLGPAGGSHGASTHLYDAIVRSVDVDGKMRVEKFASRNPPQHAIHWRSTKRLASPSLIGVVHLGARSGAPSNKINGRGLRLSDPILWGEIVNIRQHPKDEAVEKQNGNLCINMLSITGKFDPDQFAEGDVVALLDAQTFVPEYIPVLRAFEPLAQQTLPFDDGALLNLWQSRPADTSNTIGHGAAEYGNATDIDQRVSDMIRNSKLQPIKEIRHNEVLSRLLQNQLADLIRKTTLDKGQMVNFIDALRNPVHLTQGPPGTGKSYLGVVLVRAFMIIRRMWMQQNPSVGQPPILVLSYKNHAIDEFLGDLINVEQFSVSKEWGGGVG